jgi:PEP-CTERM motif
MKHLQIYLFAFFAINLSSQAAITVSGSGATGTLATFEITEPLTFNITTGLNSVDTLILVFDQWVNIVDAGETNVVFSLPLNYIQKNIQITPRISSFADNYVFNTNSFTLGDGSITFPNIPITTGDTIIIPPQSRTFIVPPNFNPALFPTDFRGNTFFVNLGGFRVSNIVAVPEPSSIFLLAMSGLVMLGRRRNRKGKSDW